MSCDFQSMCSLRSSFPYIFRRYHGNILKTYHYAWDAFEYIDNISKIRSCEQEIIKLDKIELQHSLHQLCIKTNELLKPYYISKEIACVLFHLINVFCTPGQKEKMRLVQVKLNEVLHTVTEEERCDIIERYISQLLKAKSSLTEIDMLTGQIDSQHELLCKLFYWDRFYSKNGNEGCKEFLKINADFLVSNIEGMATNWGFMWHKKLQLIACNILLCLLNWNICKTQKPVILQKDMEKPVPSSVSLVADPSTNYSFTNRASNMLQKILSTLSEKEIFKAFNDYFEQIYAMNSEITEDDLCFGMIEPYNEFLLKLCYCDAFCKKNHAFCMEFLRRNADLFVSQIELVADEENKKSKPISCTILLCLLNLNMCTLKTTPLMVQNTEIQACPSDVSVADTSANYYYTAETIRSILQKLLSILSEDDILTAFNDYLEQTYAMKSEITEDDFCSNKIEPYHECMLKLCYCTGKWSKTEVDFITKNTEFFLSTVEEVNKRNQLRVKFKMCQVLSIIMNGKIHIAESMIFSVKKMHINDELSGRLTDSLPIKIDTNRIIACIFHLKTKLNNLRTLTEKISIQYQNHIKELLLSLLADMLILLSTQDILEAVYPCLENSCVANQNIQLELAKIFLDISINPKISSYKKLIIGSKIQPIISSHDNSNTALPPTTELTDSTLEKLDHKRIINICINIVKTKSKSIDINIQMYEGYFCTERKAIDNEVEMEKRSQETETLVLLMLLLITITSTGHHKSAKLKKYLTLKYEYATASLYLLWCSGDIEVHPGPSLNKKTLAHDSTIERRWIQNISPKIINRLQEHEQSKPTKKVRNDRENREHFKALLKTCLEEKVHVPKMYLDEINAWETMEYTILHQLFVNRCEIKTIKASLQDIIICGGSTKDLTKINVSLDTELNTNDITTIPGKDHRPTDKSQLMVYITRHIAGISIKCAHGKDPDAKCDGLWDKPLKHWPKHIILFDPNNRGKYSKKHPGQKLISDQDLVDMLLTLPQVIIPKKYKEIVTAFMIMRKSQKDKSINKMHKAELCSTFKRIISLDKIEHALKNIRESGSFRKVVHNKLYKMGTTRAVDTNDDKNFSLVDIKDAEKKGPPHMLMSISKKSMTLTEEQTDANSSQVSYEFPFSDELVPLKTMDSTVHQTTIQKPSIDSNQKVTAKTYFTVSPNQDACPTDNQTNSIIIPPAALKVLNTLFPCHLYPDSQAILENDIKHQHEMSSQETALCSIHLDQPTFSTNQFSQWNQNIPISSQPGPILCTPNQSTTNSDDTSSATKDSQSLDFYTQVSPTSDMGSSDSISSVNSESGNDEGDQNNISNGRQVLLTDSDYSSDSSYNCLSTNTKKRKCTEEKKTGMKKRRKTSPKPGKEQTETNHTKTSASTDTSTIFNTNMELLLEGFNIDIDSFKLNAIYIDNKNQQNSDKAGSLRKDCTQMSNENTNASAYKTKVSTELEMFIQDMINSEGEKMSQMKSYLSDV